MPGADLHRFSFALLFRRQDWKKGFASVEAWSLGALKKRYPERRDAYVPELLKR